MKNAIVTLCLGERTQRRFRGAFLPSWREYCDRHGLGLVVLDKPLDTGARAAARSPAWQKCLVHRARETEGYERIAWVDADIMISPRSPDVFAAVPPDRIGAVDDHAIPSAEEHRFVTEKAHELWASRGLVLRRAGSAPEWYALRGIDCRSPHVVQTGMFVFAPRLHGAVLEKAYYSYENAGDVTLNHEMGPLSCEMIGSGCVHWLPAKYNMIWVCWQLLHYPFLEQPETIPGRLPLAVKRKIAEYLRGPCVRTTLRNNHFLHFSGSSSYYRYL